MILAPGGGFLALWNGIRDPLRQAEYETWHAFEHVPERVGSPGFTWAQRYCTCDADGAAATPTYFTLYALQSVEALLTPRYRELLDQPSDWSAAMRGQLTDFCRLPCTTLGSHGLSAASLMAPIRLRLQDTAALTELNTWLRAEVSAGRLVQAALGQSDERSAHPLAASAVASARDDSVDAVALLGHFDRAALESALEALGAHLRRLAPAAPWRARPALYQLQSAICSENLPAPLDQRQPPRPDLQQRFTR